MANLNSKISIPKDVLFKDVGGEAVLLNLDTGQYYGLDEVGTRMWSLLSEHGQVEATYQELLAEYDVDSGPLQADLLELVDELAHHRLLRIDDSS